MKNKTIKSGTKLTDGQNNLIKCLECNETNDIYKQIKIYDNPNQDNKHVNFDIDINNYICLECLNYKIDDFINYNLDVKYIKIKDNEILYYDDFKQYYNFNDISNDFDDCIHGNYSDIYDQIINYYFESVGV